MNGLWLSMPLNFSAGCKTLRPMFIKLRLYFIFSCSAWLWPLRTAWSLTCLTTRLARAPATPRSTSATRCSARPTQTASGTQSPAPADRQMKSYTSNKTSQETRTEKVGMTTPTKTRTKKSRHGIFEQYSWTFFFWQWNCQTKLLTALFTQSI